MDRDEPATAHEAYLMAERRENSRIIIRKERRGMVTTTTLPETDQNRPRQPLAQAQEDLNRRELTAQRQRYQDQNRQGNDNYRRANDNTLNQGRYITPNNQRGTNFPQRDWPNPRSQQNIQYQYNPAQPNYQQGNQPPQGTKPQIDINNHKQTAIITAITTGPSPQISETITETLNNTKETTHSQGFRGQTITMVVTGIKLRAGSEMQ